MPYSDTVQDAMPQMQNQIADFGVARRLAHVELRLHDVASHCPLRAALGAPHGADAAMSIPQLTAWSFDPS
jgi:hypothetical protein